MYGNEVRILLIAYAVFLFEQKYKNLDKNIFYYYENIFFLQFTIGHQIVKVTNLI